MAFTRDIIQGFIDGFITAGGDPSDLVTPVKQYIHNHPTYKPDENEVSLIQSDITSYRVTPVLELAPTPVATVQRPITVKVGP